MLFDTQAVFTGSRSDVQETLAGKRILFANFPADGHFNPLTGLAVHLQSLGCDVRWYTSGVYAERIAKLHIMHYPYKFAKDVNMEILEQVFPERNKIKGAIKKLNFDIINAFILRAPEYYADLADIQRSFPFDMVIADCAFTGIPFVTDRLRVPVIAIGVLPLVETSKDLPPSGIAMTPSYTWLGRNKQKFLRFLADNLLFRKPNRIMRQLMNKYGIDHLQVNVFDLLVKKSSLFLQSGSPGFEYTRSDLGRNIRFIGPLLPYSPARKNARWFDERLTRYEKIVLVTQGTVEKNVNKILVPVLEAFKDSNTLIIATTGGSDTAALRARFPQRNLIIEDFIPFADVMPYVNVYVTNGGYGGVMLGIENKLPLVVAGVHEGKNEINARIGYFKLGVNLKTEWPKPLQMKNAIDKVLEDPGYRENVIALSEELSTYHPNALCAQYAASIFTQTSKPRMTAN